VVTGCADDRVGVLGILRITKNFQPSHQTFSGENRRNQAFRADAFVRLTLLVRALSTLSLLIVALSK
jgi:hypothetical protein